MTNTKVNSTLLKNVNRKKILSVVDEAGTISRVEVKNLLRKNGKTVTNITNSLIEDGLVISTGYSSFTGGRRRELLSLNPHYGYIVGIHLGIRYLRGVITNFKNEILSEERIPISRNESKAILIGKVKKTLDFLLKTKSASIDKLLGIGFVANGVSDYKTGEWIISVNNPNWKNVPIRRILIDMYDVPVYTESNSRAMALAEISFGRAKKRENLIYVNLGEGVGCGIINDGLLYRGINNKAGEFGHTIVVPNGRLCSCGNHGCLETVASGWAIKNLVKDSISKGVKSEIVDICDGNMDNLETAMVFEAYQNGDQLATEILDDASYYLGISVANIINLFNPDVLVLGGYSSTLSDKFLENLQTNVKKFAMPLLYEETQILTSSLGDNGAALGAVTMVRNPHFHLDVI